MQAVVAAIRQTPKIHNDPVSHLFQIASAHEFPINTRHVPEEQVVPDSQNWEFELEQIEPAGIVQISKIQFESDSQLDDRESAQEPPMETRHAPDKQEVPTKQY